MLHSGVPLWVDEFSLTLKVDQGGRVHRKGSVFVKDAPNVPKNLDSVLSLRLDQCSSLARTVIKIAACLSKQGTQFVFSDLNSVASLMSGLFSIDANTVNTALEELEDRQIISRLVDRISGNGVVFEFQHRSMKEVAISLLTRGQRCKIHETIGKYYEEKYAKTSPMHHLNFVWVLIPKQYKDLVSEKNDEEEDFFCYNAINFVPSLLNIAYHWDHSFEPGVKYELVDPRFKALQYNVAAAKLLELNGFDDECLDLLLECLKVTEALLSISKKKKCACRVTYYRAYILCHLGKNGLQNLSKYKEQSANYFKEVIAMEDPNVKVSESDAFFNVKLPSFSEVVMSSLSGLYHTMQRLCTSRNETDAQFRILQDWVKLAKGVQDPVHLCNAMCRVGEHNFLSAKISEAVENCESIILSYDYENNHCKMRESYGSDWVLTTCAKCYVYSLLQGNVSKAKVFLEKLNVFYEQCHHAFTRDLCDLTLSYFYVAMGSDARPLLKDAKNFYERMSTLSETGYKGPTKIHKRILVLWDLSSVSLKAKKIGLLGKYDTVNYGLFVSWPKTSKVDAPEVQDGLKFVLACMLSFIKAMATSEKNETRHGLSRKHGTPPVLHTTWMRLYCSRVCHFVGDQNGASSNLESAKSSLQLYKDRLEKCVGADDVYGPEFLSLCAVVKLYEYIDNISEVKSEIFKLLRDAIKMAKHHGSFIFELRIRGLLVRVLKMFGDDVMELQEEQSNLAECLNSKDLDSDIFDVLKAQAKALLSRERR